MAMRALRLPWAGLLSNAWRPFTAGMLGRATWNGVFTCPSISECRTFSDHDVLDVPGRLWVIHVPGHTAGECVFLAGDRLFSGDALVTLDLFTGRPVPPSVPRRVLNSDYRMACRSLDGLRELGEVTLLPGHGLSWRGRADEAEAAAFLGFPERVDGGRGDRLPFHSRVDDGVGEFAEPGLPGEEADGEGRVEHFLG